MVTGERQAVRRDRRYRRNGQVSSGAQRRLPPGMQTRAAMSSVKAKEVPRSREWGIWGLVRAGVGGAGVH